MRRICCFAGHHDLFVDKEIAEKLEKLIIELIEKEKVNEFWVNHNGNFDALAGETVRKMKKTYHDIELNLVIPYLTSVIDKNKEYYYSKYNNILLADIPENAPNRYHITYCDEYMVQRSDFIICYISHNWGGAAKTMKYAESQKHIKVFNIAEN